MRRKMIKEHFLQKYKRHLCAPDGYHLRGMEDMFPRVFCVESIYKEIEQGLGGQNKGRKEKRCDQFVFCDMPDGRAGLYIIERKGRTVSVSEVRAQLQKCADFIRDNVPPGKIAFAPVVVAKRRPSAYKRKKDKKDEEDKRSRRATVTLRNESVRIRYLSIHDEDNPPALKQIRLGHGQR